MRKTKKGVFFIITFVIVLFVVMTFSGFYTQFGDIKKVYIKGVNDIRWGIDIRGGVDVTFTPPEGRDATNEEMDSVKELIAQRMIGLNITDYESYVDYDKDRLILRFPWKSDDDSFDAEAAVKEIGETAELTFREGHNVDENGAWTGVTEKNIILTGNDIVLAEPRYDEQDSKYIVALKLGSEGTVKFADATERLLGDTISIWMDETCISYPTVQAKISTGEATISGNFTAESATALANKITAGALPFKLEIESLNTISPTLGLSAKSAMTLAGVISFAAIAVIIIVLYRLPGLVAVIALLGQAAGCIAAVTGFFGFMSSSTLTIPGIAGIILSIGMGVDANIITSERIKEELLAGKSIDGAIQTGYSNAFSSIFDGNLTNIIVAVVLMGSFGPPQNFLTTIFKPLFFFFGTSTEATIYSFGFTLIVGVIFNFIMSILFSHLMLSAVSKFKPLRKLSLYGVKESDLNGGELNG